MDYWDARTTKLPRCFENRVSRRAILEGIDFNEKAHVPEVFTDGAALFDAVCEWEMEGVVAKRLHEPYRPGERAWVKTENREYWRYEMERESTINRRRQRMFV